MWVLFSCFWKGIFLARVWSTSSDLNITPSCISAPFWGAELLIRVVRSLWEQQDLETSDSQRGLHHRLADWKLFTVWIMNHSGSLRLPSVQDWQASLLCTPQWRWREESPSLMYWLNWKPITMDHHYDQLLEQEGGVEGGSTHIRMRHPFNLDSLRNGSALLMIKNHPDLELHYALPLKHLSNGYLSNGNTGLLFLLCLYILVLIDTEYFKCSFLYSSLL